MSLSVSLCGYRLTCSACDLDQSKPCVFFLSRAFAYAPSMSCKSLAWNTRSKFVPVSYWHDIIDSLISSKCRQNDYAVKTSSKWLCDQKQLCRRNAVKTILPSKILMPSSLFCRQNRSAVEMPSAYWQQLAIFEDNYIHNVNDGICQ